MLHPTVFLVLPYPLLSALKHGTHAISMFPTVYMYVEPYEVDAQEGHLVT